MHADCNRRILIIDDNLAIHEDFRKILRSQAAGNAFAVLSAGFFGEQLAEGQGANFELDSAFQGQEGCEMVRQASAAGRPYGVAFIDVRMPPGWDGIETAAKIWEICPELQVVLCTAYTDYGWEGITDKLGKTDRLLILKKPFDPVEVLPLAETLSRKWTLAQQAKLRLADLDAMVQRRTQELLASNARLVQEIEVRARAQVLLSAFADLGAFLSSARTVREAGQIIIDTASRLLGWDACLLHLYSPATETLTQVLRVEVIDGQKKEAMAGAGEPLLSSLVRKTLQEGGQLVLKGGGIPAAEWPFDPAAGEGASLVLAPIRNGKEVTGVVALQSNGSHTYDGHSLEMLQALADHCGGALDRIRTEEALRAAQDDLGRAQKLEAVGQLAAGIAHDFNNLLAVIRGNADLARMEAEGLSNELNSYLGQIVAATERAANLTRQLLTFSRKQIMQSEPVDVAGLILNLSQMLRRLIGENIDLRSEYAATLPLALGDSGKLEQVLVNLVINARDAMPDGGQLLIKTELVTLGTEAAQFHPEARPGNYIRLTVGDTGCGIAPEHLPQIFDPFFTTKEVGKGTGLGLATAYGIVKQHQGWIEVSSTLGVGSQFRVLLPALKGAGANVRRSWWSKMKKRCAPSPVCS